MHGQNHIKFIKNSVRTSQGTDYVEIRRQ